MRLTYRGREIDNPLLRMVAIFVLLVGMLFLIVMIPVMLVLHPVFKLFGLTGTIRPEPYGQLSLKLDSNSFKRNR